MYKSHARWAPSRSLNKWSYNPYRWLYKCMGFTWNISPINKRSSFTLYHVYSTYPFITLLGCIRVLTPVTHVFSAICRGDTWYTIFQLVTLCPPSRLQIWKHRRHRWYQSGSFNLGETPGALAAWFGVKSTPPPPKKGLIKGYGEGQFTI